MNVRLPEGAASIKHTWKLREASKEVADDIYEKAVEVGRKSAEKYANKYISDVLAMVLWTLYKDEGWGEGRMVRLLARTMANSHDILDAEELPDGAADVAKDRMKRMGIDVDRLADVFASDPALARKTARYDARALNSDSMITSLAE